MIFLVLFIHKGENSINIIKGVPFAEQIIPKPHPLANRKHRFLFNLANSSMDKEDIDNLGEICICLRWSDFYKMYKNIADDVLGGKYNG